MAVLISYSSGLWFGLAKLIRFFSMRVMKSCPLHRNLNSFLKKELRFRCKGQDFITLIEKNRISFANPNYGLEEYEINTAIMTVEQANQRLNKYYQSSEIRAFLRIAEDMGMIEKDLNKVEVKTETSEYETCDSEMTWEDEVDIELDNILSDYNPAE